MVAAEIGDDDLREAGKKYYVLYSVGLGGAKIAPSLEIGAHGSPLVQKRDEASTTTTLTFAPNNAALFPDTPSCATSWPAHAHNYYY